MLVVRSEPFVLIPDFRPVEFQVATIDLTPASFIKDSIAPVIITSFIRKNQIIIEALKTRTPDTVEQILPDSVRGAFPSQLKRLEVAMLTV